MRAGYTVKSKLVVFCMMIPTNVRIIIRSGVDLMNIRNHGTDSIFFHARSTSHETPYSSPSFVQIDTKMDRATVPMTAI